MPLLLATGGVLLLANGGQFLLASDSEKMHTRAPTFRTVQAGTGTVASGWTVPLDPNALLDFTISWSEEMTGGADTILTAVITLSQQATAAGLLVHAESHDDDSVTAWLKVDTDFQQANDWNGPGETHTLSCKVTTPKGRTHDRTFTFTVRHT